MGFGKKTSRAGYARLLCGATMLTCLILLAGCGGSGGGDDAPGGGGTGGTDIAAAAEINAVINSVSIASPPVVSFSLADENGDPVVGLPAGAISFKLAKLVPGTDGATSFWQSYINRIEQPGVGPGTVAQLQATTESGSAGVLVDNNDGTYSYTFALDISNVTDPVAVSYIPTLTHRVTFEIRGYVPVDNPSYDWRPSDNATSSLFTREIAKTESCNVCHDTLALHGDARFEMRDCVTCHNPGSADANSANSLDMTVMTHKIHRGADLPSVEAGGDYCIYGFMNFMYCYGDVVYPQDIRNCRSCHDESDPQTPDAVRWITQPGSAACGSCHDDVNFASGENHSETQIVATDIECATCHGASPEDPLGVLQTHRVAALERAADYRFDILGVAFTAADGGPSTPTVTLAISNPQLGGPDDVAARYDLENNPELAASTLNLRLAWNTVDYSNWGSGTGNAQPQNISLYASGVLRATPNGDLSYNLAVGAVPDCTTGTGVIIFDGSVRTLDAGKAPVAAAHYYFGISDDPAIPRRISADLARCNDCHALITFHGDNRNESLEDCQVCHNANAARSNASPMDMKVFLHRIHAVDDILYPQRSSNCLACHTDDGFYPLAAGSGVLASSVNRFDPGAPPPGPGAQPLANDPTNNNRISANAAACGVCHSSAGAQSHMQGLGSSYDACQEADGILRQRVDFCGTGGDKTGALVTENCSGCHGPGGRSDTAVRHQLEL